MEGIMDMLKRGKKREDAVPAEKTSADLTYIHKDTALTGNLNAKGRVRIDGTVRGNITVEGILEIAESGTVEGELIKATIIKIIGHVKANIEATKKVEIWQKGRLEGDVRAAALDIEEGALFIGRSEMRTSAQAVMSLPKNPDLGKTDLSKASQKANEAA